MGAFVALVCFVTVGRLTNWGHGVAQAGELAQGGGAFDGRELHDDIPDTHWRPKQHVDANDPGFVVPPLPKPPPEGRLVIEGNALICKSCKKADYTTEKLAMGVTRIYDAATHVACYVLVSADQAHTYALSCIQLL